MSGLNITPLLLLSIWSSLMVTLSVVVLVVFLVIMYMRK
jgi:hypothetical protein